MSNAEPHKLIDVKQLFLREAGLQEHFDAQQHQYSDYTGMLLLLLHQGVALSHATKTRALAACWARHDFEVASFLLDQEAWSLPEVVKALKLLDAGRQIRALQRRLSRLETQGCAKPATLGQLRSSIQDLQREPQIGSLSGALIRHIKRWFRQLPEDKLSFYALSMPPEPWRELADLLHMKPQDFQLSWFLPVIFGETPPEGSMAAACLSATDEDLPTLISQWKAPYSFIRRRFPLPIADELRGEIAAYETLDTLLWYYEELACPATDERIAGRLADGEAPGFGYGMLVERMLLFESLGAPFFKALIPIAEAQLKSIKLPLESPVVVLGDASSSMDVAIRVSTIVGSLLAALTGAKIRFFNQYDMMIDGETEFSPQSLSDMMDLVKRVRASGMTSPAASLVPSLQKREVVRHFIMVTDEEENTKAHIGDYSKEQLAEMGLTWRDQKMFFAPMLKFYRDEIYPAKVTFISFLRNPQEPGHMTPQLDDLGIPYQGFVMNGQRPDLTKIDALLGLLASESAFFQEQAEQLAQDIDAQGVGKVIHSLTQEGPGDQKDILRTQLSTIRDLAFARSQDRQALLQLLGKARQLAKVAGIQQMEETLAPLLAEMVQHDAQSPIGPDFFETLLRQTERLEFQLQG